ncbi:hypothetical protein SNE40_005320 [Patella caerulea]|uniref:Uncharacterized protein n=1 Tax=Patella caerulea TaxID=87958 RepID=A0AAN8K7W9_PATCE
MDFEGRFFCLILLLTTHIYIILIGSTSGLLCYSAVLNPSQDATLSELLPNPTHQLHQIHPDNLTNNYVSFKPAQIQCYSLDDEEIAHNTQEQSIQQIHSHSLDDYAIAHNTQEQSIRQIRCYSSDDAIAHNTQQQSIQQIHTLVDEENNQEQSIPQATPAHFNTSALLPTSPYKQCGLEVIKLETMMKTCPLTKNLYKGMISINDINRYLESNPVEPSMYLVSDGSRPMIHVTLLYMFTDGRKPLYFDSNAKCPPLEIKDHVDWNHVQVQGNSNNTCALHCIFVANKLGEGKSLREIFMEREYVSVSCDHKDDEIIHYYEALVRNYVPHFQ